MGIQFPTDPLKDQVLSSVCVCVGVSVCVCELCVSELCVWVCVWVSCVCECVWVSCVRGEGGRTRREEAEGGWLKEGGRKCATKNKNPTQWCGEKTDRSPRAEVPDSPSACREFCIVSWCLCCCLNFWVQLDGLMCFPNSLIHIYIYATAHFSDTSLFWVCPQVGSHRPHCLFAFRVVSFLSPRVLPYALP